MMYKYVFFDLDGTLLNTLEDLADAGNYALREQGFPVFETQEYRYLVGNGIPKLIERIVPKGSESAVLERTHKLFSEHYTAHDTDKTKPYEGITGLLTELKAENVGTVVITNKDDKYAKGLIRHYFGDLIGFVFGNLPGIPHKPDPFLVNKAIDELGAEKTEILYVGDSGVDMLTAKNSGLAGCGVLWGFRGREELEENGAAFICSEPSQILDLVLGK